MDWKDAFFRQAESDFILYHEFKERKNEIPLCQRLHYFQMTTEKLAKAYLTSFYGKPPKTSHKKFVAFFRASKNHPRIWKTLGFKTHKDYVRIVDTLLPLVEKIESLAPTNNNQPNPEYPWEVNTTVYSPLDYTFPEIYGIKNKTQSGFRRIEKIVEELVRKKIL